MECSLEITEEPALEHRFRYATDIGSHGSLMGRNHNSNNRSFPKIKIHNYFGVVKIILSLWAVKISEDNTRTYLPHVHKLKNHNEEEIEENIRDGSEIELSNFYIENVKKSEIKNILKFQYEENKKKERIRNGFTGELTESERKQVHDESKIHAKILEEEFHTVCLKIEAYDANNQQICNGVFSKLIHHQKTPLKIIRSSKYSGVTEGGEEIIILCDEVDAGNVHVRFFEENGSWEAFGECLLVWHKVAMVVKIPPYKKKNIDKDVAIKFHLMREYEEHEYCTSESHKFTYELNPDMKDLKRKRQKTAESMNDSLQNMIQTYLSESISTSDFNFEALDRNSDELPQENNRAPLSFTDLVPRSGISSNENEGNTLPYADIVECDSGGICTENETNSIKLFRSIILQLANLLKKNCNSHERKNLLDTIAKFIALPNKDGDNLIHFAVLHAWPINTVLLHLLKISQLSETHSINGFNRCSQTPLHLAVLVHSASLAKILIYHGANPNLADHHGNTAMHLACNYARYDIIEVLLDECNYYKKDYYKNKPRFNNFNKDGYTPLHLAVLSNLVHVVEKLYSFGIDINLPEQYYGKTAIHLAVEKSNMEVLEVLLRIPTIQVNKKMNNGNSPLHLACSLGVFKAVSLLMEAGANPYLETEINSSNHSRYDCFDLARNNRKILNLLVEKGYKYDNNLNQLHTKQIGCNEAESKHSRSLNFISLDKNFFPVINSQCSTQKKFNRTVNLEIPCKIDEIDDETKAKLASLLDTSSGKNWECLLKVLEFDCLHSWLKNSHSPTLTLLTCIKDITDLRKGLALIDLQEALDIIDEYLNRFGHLSRISIENKA